MPSDKLNPGGPRQFSFNNVLLNYQSKIFTLEISQNTEKYNEGKKTHYQEIIFGIVPSNQFFKTYIDIQNCILFSSIEIMQGIIYYC